MSVVIVISFLCLFFGIGVKGQNEFGEIVFQDVLRWNYTYMNPTCSGPNGGRNPCTDIRICTFAVASLAIGGWPTLCGWVGKGVPKVCCGLPLVLGEGLMKKVDEERSRNKECGTTTYSFETETINIFMSIKDSLPEVDISDPNKFDPPLDLGTESMLIPPSVYTGSQQGKFPWMVSIRQNGLNLCGGSLIDRKNILTAASCISEDIAKYAVHVGNLYVDDGYVFNINKISIHPHYDANKKYNNLAIITLSKEILSPNVAHICLMGSETAGLNMEGMDTTLLQWDTKIENGEKRQYLNVIHGLTIVPTEKCLRVYQECGHGFPTELGDDFICIITSEESDMEFEENIGGPLMYRNGPPISYLQIPWTAVAVDTFGSMCTHARTLRLLTKVSSNMDWIEQIINE